MLHSKKLSKFPEISHGFFNKSGGVSEGIYKSLNCGVGSNDKKDNVKKNLKIVKKRISKNSKKISLDFLPIFLFTILRFFFTLIFLSFEPIPQFKLL